MSWYKAKYGKVKPTFKGGSTNYHSVNATKKYIEYFLDIQEMNRLLISTKNFDVKMDLLYCLDRAESKKQWNFKHPNFNSKTANQILQAVRLAGSHDDALDVLEKY